MVKKIASHKSCSQTAAVMVALLSLLFSAGPVQAAGVINSCTTYCHGLPPRDGTRLANSVDISQTSRTAGNHGTHSSVSPLSCSICHVPVVATNYSHQNDVIEMRSSLKGYSSANARAKYNKGVFFNQTSIPATSTCSNVSCHFETTTPAWGGSLSNGCSSCHASPPVGAGSHSRHSVYFPGVTSCALCHSTIQSFSHATSAGRAIRVQGYLQDPSGLVEPSGTYSGTGLNYFPSQSASRTFGSCSNIYCHSNSGPNGTSRLYAAPTWGGGTLSCGACHNNMSVTGSTAPNGGHYAHTSTANTSGLKLVCSSCHSGYSATSVTTASHVNQLVQITFSGSAVGTTYSKTAPIAAGTAWGSCSTTKCHGSGTAQWGGALWSTTDQCGKCHSSNAAGAITQAAPFYSTAFPVKVTANNDAKVGAHTNHMTSQTLGISASTACTDCHGAVTLTGATHMNSSTTLSWSALATKNGVLIPTYTALSGQCASTYCHGNSMPGGDTTGTNKSPVWNAPNYLPAAISAAACGTCHGFPPLAASGHPGGITIPTNFGNGTVTIGTTCSCHSNINSTGTTYANMFVTPSLHINGTLETPSGGHAFPYSGSLHLTAAGTTPWSACTGCHSNAAGSYPVASGTAPNCQACHIGGLKVPSGTSSCWDCHGVSATDGKPNGNAFPNISGNHTIHVAIPGTTCATCHTGGGNGAVTHGSSNRAAATAASVIVAFTGQGAAPLWTFASKTCSATNCHGQGTPAWGARTGALVNGFPYSSAQCDKCHSGTAAAPFYSTAIPKVTANTNVKVGAHTSHLTAPDGLTNAFVCADCHGTVATLTTANHMNGAANFTWSTLANNGGALTPAYTSATGACANVYCHGASMPGGDTTGTNRAPVWNSTTYLPAAISAAACGTCHGFPPLAASGHPGGITIPTNFGNGVVAIGTTCSCHSNISTTGTTYANIFVNKALHINGVFEPSAGGHAFPYSGSLHLTAAGTTPWNACTGCHSNAAGSYPVASGTAPNCQACHIGGLKVPSGTSSCYDCHGASATDGKPNGGIGTGIGGSTFPNYSGSHTVHITKALLTCASCHFGAGAGTVGHGNSNAVKKTAATVAFNGLVSTPTWTAAANTCGATTCHGTATWGGRLGCINCHSLVQTGTHGTPREAVTTEFGLAWGHKKTGRGAVTDADCIVCHLEGEFATQAKSAKHGDGNIDLRNPDGVGEVAISNISGTAFTFTKFATSYAAGSRTATGHLSNTDIANVITQKFCLACHDSDGAINTTARSGAAPTQYLPFGTGSQNGAAYTVGLSAGIVGGVVNVDSMFATTNSTFHPVKGPQNNRYASGTRMAVPYGITKTAITDGIVMNCFDCHNAPTPLTSRTVAAHGSSAPNAYRGTVYDTTNTLCKVCHTGYTGSTSHHGTGSAFASNTNSGMTTYLANQCQRCHASTNTAVRPVRSEDAHGFNRFAGTGTDAMWPRGATETYRPFAFFRNTTQWTTNSWKPLSGPGVPAGTATCGGNMSASGCGDNMTTYTPGGAY